MDTWGFPCGKAARALSLPLPSGAEVKNKWGHHDEDRHNLTLFLTCMGMWIYVCTRTRWR
jgi:hypothetical protein